MVQLLLWMVMAYGLSNIVVYSTIFEPVRRNINKLAQSKSYFSSLGVFLSGMTSCMMCFGFHCGWFLSLFVYSPNSSILGVTPLPSLLFDACLSSGAVWAINSIIEWFEQNRPTINNN